MYKCLILLKKLDREDTYMEIVDLAEKTKKELMQDEETISGEISIGCGET